MSAMAVHSFARASLARVPWKNGRGVTQDIVCRPERAGMDDFDWRVSIARIDADAPFSIFAGVDRVIVLLEGAGVRLRSSAGDVNHHLDVALAPFAFAGEADIACTVLAGESSDFNVMTRRSAARAVVTVVRDPHRLSVSGGGVLLAVHGAWDLQADGEVPAMSRSMALTADTGIWWDGDPQAWRLAPTGPDAALIAVQIWQVAEAPAA